MMTTQQLLVEAYEQTKRITLYTQIYKIDKNGLASVTHSNDYNINLDVYKFARQIKTQGLKPDKKFLLHTTIGGKTIQVISCQHDFFNSTHDDAVAEIHIIFSKPLSEIYIDHDDQDFDELGVIDGPKRDETINKIEAAFKQGKQISLAELGDGISITDNISMYGSYVLDIKPTDVIDVVLCPTYEDNEFGDILTDTANARSLLR